jgi:diguanylate cyclase (GGDEF)-like protein
MREKLRKFLYNHLLRLPFTSDNEKYLYLISIIACIYAASMQFFLLLFHLVIRVSPLFFLYLCGFLINIFLVWLIKKRRYSLFGILLSLVVITLTLASVICVGANNLVIVYLLVTLIMQIIIPYASVRIRVSMIVALWCSAFALVAFNRYMEPIWDIGEANTILSLFNIHLAFIGIIIQLTVGNIIWDVIRRFNQKKLEESQYEANTDPLTGLFNRRYANTIFKRLSTGQLGQVWCVAMLDIDEFKLFNDINGHQVGDDVLMLVSDFIKTNLHKRDFLFRWGGEEFLILLKDVDVATAFRILDKLRNKIMSENFEIKNKTIKVTVTIGVYPLDIHNIEESIDMSDRLMYDGKTSGKNVVIM